MIVSFVFWLLVCLNSYVEPYRPAISPRIVGGEPADIKDFPYQLGMEIHNYTNYMFFCGGAIIHQSWAITAAGCVSKFPKTQIRFRAGSSHHMEGGTLHYAEKIVIHPKFYGDMFVDVDYDVAIVKVSTPFQYSDVTQKISMACETPAPGTEAVVSGWGYTDEYDLSDQLQQLVVSTIEYDQCKLTDDDFLFLLTPRMLCASVPGGGRNVFIGDNGGPLVVGHTLVGIASSFVPYPNVLDVPAVYTDVATIREWVKNTIKQESRHH